MVCWSVCDIQTTPSPRDFFVGAFGLDWRKQSPPSSLASSLISFSLSLIPSKFPFSFPFQGIGCLFSILSEWPLFRPLSSHSLFSHSFFLRGSCSVVGNQPLVYSSIVFFAPDFLLSLDLNRDRHAFYTDRTAIVAGFRCPRDRELYRVPKRTRP